MTNPPPRYRQHDHYCTCCLYCGWAMPGRRAESVQCRKPKKGQPKVCLYVSTCNDDSVLPIELFMYNLWLKPFNNINNNLKNQVRKSSEEMLSAKRIKRRRWSLLVILPPINVHWNVNYWLIGADSYSPQLTVALSLYQQIFIILRDALYFIQVEKFHFSNNECFTFFRGSAWNCLLYNIECLILYYVTKKLSIC